jgi:hypothetical protein
VVAKVGVTRHAQRYEHKNQEGRPAQRKRRQGERTVRVYGPALTPYARVIAATEVTLANKRELRALHERLNPFGLAREVERQNQEINAHPLLEAA